MESSSEQPTPPSHAARWVHGTISEAMAYCRYLQVKVQPVRTEDIAAYMTQQGYWPETTMANSTLGRRLTAAAVTWIYEQEEMRYMRSSMGSVNSELIILVELIERLVTAFHATQVYAKPGAAPAIVFTEDSRDGSGRFVIVTLEKRENPQFT